MMTREQYLLQKLQEEAAEVIQRASKVNRFGLLEVQPGQTENNRDRLRGELIDLFAVLAILLDDGILLSFDTPDVPQRIEDHKNKLEKFYDYSVIRGTVEPRK